MITDESKALWKKWNKYCAYTQALFDQMIVFFSALPSWLS